MTLQPGDIVETSYGSGPYRVTGVLHGCTCPEYLNLLLSLYRKRELPRPPHMHIACMPLNGERKQYGLNGYAEMPDGSIRNVTTGDELRVTQNELWQQYCAYLEAGQPGISEDNWRVVCLTWQEWKVEA